jgi:DNA-binding NarL/FixJ family response regulator
LTGRIEELQFIADLSTVNDNPTGVVLAGAAGVGKTRLAREAIAAARRRGATVRWVAATASARALPLGIFADTVGVSGVDTTHRIRAATDALLAGAGVAGVVIGVDDAHLLDDLSAVVIHQLVMRRVATLILTVRSAEPAPDSITALWKDAHLRRVEVQPLSESETGRLLEAALGGPVDTGAVRRLWTITQGNALYLRHLVDGELRAGRLDGSAGVWQWIGRPQVSSGLAELIGHQLGQLTEPQREVMEIVAFGEPVGVTLLARLTDATAIEQVEGRRLVEVFPDGRRWQVRLIHPLYGEVQRDRCGHLRARRLRGRIAQELAATGGRRADDPLRRAVLMLDSDLAPDPELFTLAAGLAVELADFSLAQRLARVAVAAGGGFTARLILAFALGFAGQGAEAAEELVALTKTSANDRERVQATNALVGGLFWPMGRPADAEVLLATTAAEVVDEVAVLDLAGMRSVIDAWLARPVAAAATAEQVLASPLASDHATALAGWGLLTARACLGRTEGLEVTLARVDAIPASVQTSANIRMGIRYAWLMGLRLAGRLIEAERTARTYWELVRDTPGLVPLLATVMRAEVAIDRGAPRTAIRWLREVDAGLRKVDPAGWRHLASLGLATAYGMSGDESAARHAHEAFEGCRHPSFTFVEPNVELSRAWVAAAAGAASAAVAHARQAADLAAVQGQPALEVLALHTAVCFGDRTVAHRLAVLAGQVDGPRAPAAAAHAAALAADDGSALDAASIEIETIGAILFAADAAAQAASAYARHGRRGSANVAAARAHALAQACEGARTPALAAAAAPLPLTGREREIVTLAARGLTNRQIAEWLVVSVRTVEGHLYRASAKLGTTNRADLATLLRPDP